MMSLIKNLLAAFGALILIIIALILIISYNFSGRLSYGDKVAVVKVEGLITDAMEVNLKLKEFAERDDVKAVVLRIDSPGGAVGPSQEIHREVKRLRETKTVVASMGSIAGSGGYYAAVAAEKIVANPGTLTGSIGVIVEFVNARELLDKIGLKGYVIKSGRFKDVGSPFRDMEPEEKRMLQELIDDVKSQFIEAVAEGRGLTTEEVTRIADGRVFTGSQAKDLGLVDELGSLADAIDLSAELAGIKGKPKVIYPEKKFGGFLQAFLGTELTRSFTEIFSGLRIMYLVPTP